MNLEINKIFAAVLVAGITASFSGFVADILIHPHEVAAVGPEAEGSGGAVDAAPELPEPVPFARFRPNLFLVLFGNRNRKRFSDSWNRFSVFRFRF